MDWSGINAVSAAIINAAKKAQTPKKGLNPNDKNFPKRHWGAQESNESEGR